MPAFLYLLKNPGYAATAISGIVRDSSVKWYNKAIPENNTVTRNCDKYK